MRLDAVERRLRVALAGPLPGHEAQARFAPQPRPGWPAGTSLAGARPAAALLLLYPVDGLAHVVLTLRGAHLPSHAGQVSLPGGAIEAGETVEAAALREAQEEIALEPAAVRVLGALTPLPIPVSGFLLHPVVGVADTRPAMRPADGEVDRILEVALDDLADPARRSSRTATREGRGAIEIPYIDVEGAELWGATAMILSELLWLLDAPAATGR